MSTVQGNLSALAKDVERAQQKVQKVHGRGDSGKVESANTELGTAQSQWESQAPYIFENLQALDENRVNHLRDVLTQFQTHEVDMVEKNRVTAESCLNLLLNVETKDEITTFALRAQQQKPTLNSQKRQSVMTPLRPPPTTAGSSNYVPPSLPRTDEDRTGSREESIPEDKQKGRLKGLRRLGTVMGRKRESKYGSPLPTTSESPERKPKLRHSTHLLEGLDGRKTRRHWNLCRRRLRHDSDRSLRGSAVKCSSRSRLDRPLEALQVRQALLIVVARHLRSSTEHLSCHYRTAAIKATCQSWNRLDRRSQYENGRRQCPLRTLLLIPLPSLRRIAKAIQYLSEMSIRKRQRNRMQRCLVRVVLRR